MARVYIYHITLLVFITLLVNMICIIKFYITQMYVILAKSLENRFS